MKRYWKDLRHRTYNQRRAVKSLEARLRFKAYQLDKNKDDLRLAKGRRTLVRTHADYKKVIAPPVFSLLANPEPVINFINTLKDHFENKRKVLVILRNIQKIDHDAIVVLLSILVRFKSHGIPFNGDFPDDDKSREFLKRSGFFKILYNRTFEDEESYNIQTGTRNVINTHASKVVDARLGAELIESATQTIWGKPKRCQGIQTTLLELMQNTNNHAVPQRKGEKHWWLSLYHSIGEKKVRFSFVDYGVGIFKSLENKTPESKFYGALERMFERFKYGNNAELLKLIINGELHKTVTEEYFRGQGLPGILDSVKTNWFSNAHIISNDVYANICENKYVLLRSNFSGTFIYWEVDATNHSFDK